MFLISAKRSHICFVLPIVIYTSYSNFNPCVTANSRIVTVDACDIFPTLLEVAKIDPKPYYQTEKIDGRSIYPLIKDVKNKKNTYLRDEFVWHYPFNVQYRNPIDGLALTPHSAIRVGDMKLIFDWHGRLYLFNIKKDPYEGHNLAAEMPNKTRELFARLITWFDNNVEARYLPTFNPAYNPAKESRPDTPYVDLVACFRSGGDVVKTAKIPDMNLLVIK